MTPLDRGTGRTKEQRKIRYMSSSHCNKWVQCKRLPRIAEKER
ncbi:unnamed protein product [Staurois parvus]|uniref:Uncharacterized protein n=1 Tax=Staurois parvus TaxID=386267 RepID=A0ABN9DRT2_9NEOB|nr:unnamed protein product [Staurois parvus]